MKVRIVHVSQPTHAAIRSNGIGATCTASSPSASPGGSSSGVGVACSYVPEPGSKANREPPSTPQSTRSWIAGCSDGISPSP